MSVDVCLVEKCREHYSKARILLEEIEAKVLEFCHENGIDLLFRGDGFEPVWSAEDTEHLMVFKAVKGLRLGYVAILKDGKITWIESK
jgi:hypothetical protein